MKDDFKTLEECNIRIGIEESKGDDESRSWLDSILAPQLNFRRAEWVTFDNRDQIVSLTNVGRISSNRLHRNDTLLITWNNCNGCVF